MSFLEKKEHVFDGWEPIVITPDKKSNKIMGEVYKKDIGKKSFAVSIERVIDNSYKTLGWAVNSVFKRGNIPVRSGEYFIDGKNKYTMAYDNLVKRLEKINLEEINQKLNQQYTSEQ